MRVPAVKLRGAAAVLALGLLGTASSRAPRTAVPPGGSLEDEIRACVAEIDHAASTDPKSVRALLAPGPRLPRAAIEATIDAASGLKVSRRSDVRHVVGIGDSAAAYSIVERIASRKATESQPGDYFETRAQIPRVYFFHRTPAGWKLARVEGWDPACEDRISADVIYCRVKGWRMPRPADWFVVPADPERVGAFGSVS
ncbi:MAG TPA: hypothetical protein VKE69_00565, partial [Planctomycetota bacterium]|nr:hypothetical protein [Planctomycetota bacterium]